MRRRYHRTLQGMQRNRQRRTAGCRRFHRVRKYLSRRIKKHSRRYSPRHRIGRCHIRVHVAAESRNRSRFGRIRHRNTRNRPHRTARCRRFHQARKYSSPRIQKHSRRYSPQHRIGRCHIPTAAVVARHHRTPLFQRIRHHNARNRQHRTARCRRFLA